MFKILSFSCVSLFKGFGLAHLFNFIFIIYYYNVIIAWCVYFFGASFATTLPWTGCDIDGAERLLFQISQIQVLYIQVLYIQVLYIQVLYMGVSKVSLPDSNAPTSSSPCVV